MISSKPCGRIRTYYLQSISITYAVAFYSLYLQIPGLFGDDGILPVANKINGNDITLWRQMIDLLWRDPTILHFSSSFGLSVTQMMEVLCLVGTAVSIFVTVNSEYTIKPFFFVLWVFYLSLYKVGQTFLSFQWDVLLLEAGFLAIIAAPISSGSARKSLPHDSITLFLVRWLLFRMMFSSGVVKLTSGCPTWWGLTALPIHYYSQCLPTPLAWFAHQLPDWLHKLSVAGTFIIEIPFTFFFFAPTSTLRKFTCFHQVILMVVIMLSGNYNFFNFLFMALCLSLADDSWLTYYNKYEKPQHLVTKCICCLLHLLVFSLVGFLVGQMFNIRVTKQFVIESNVAFTEKQFDDFVANAVPVGIGLGILGLVYACCVAFWKSFNSFNCSSTLYNVITVLFYFVVATFMFAVSLPSFTGQLDRSAFDKLPTQFKVWDRNTRQFSLTSSYGLFRQMTGVDGRPEIILEGSDNVHGPWKEFEFAYKPGNVSASPLFCLPHQPRLDWQMWFAALGSYQHNPWFISLVHRLLEGKKDVVNLMQPGSAFTSQPPKFIRALLYKYHFSSAGSKDWWERTFEKEYLPIVSKKDGLEQLLQHNGIYGAKSTPGVGLIPWGLQEFRTLSNRFSHTIQIWSLTFFTFTLSL